MKLICFGQSNKRNIYVNPEYIVSVDECGTEGMCEVHTTIGRFFVDEEAEKVAMEIMNETRKWVSQK